MGKPGQTQAAGAGIRQLVAVKSTGGANALLACYEKGPDGLWRQVLAADAFIGRAGVSAAHREGDMASPAGLYALGTAFSTEAQVPFGYPCRTITPDSYWVDDPASPLYNQWVEGRQGFASAEHLIDHPDAYHYGVVVEYNTGPVTPGRGSAIFFHCKSQKPYTFGCAAVDEAVMLRVLAWLDPAAAPHILFV